MLRQRSLTTADQLAHALGVSRRTIYRDMRQLIARGVGVRGEAGVGYALARSIDPPPLSLSADEVAALASCARLAELDDEPLARALQKLEAVGPREQGSVLEQLQRAVAERREISALVRRERWVGVPLALWYRDGWAVAARSTGGGYEVLPVSALTCLEVGEPAPGAAPIDAFFAAMAGLNAPGASAGATRRPGSS